MTGLVPMTQGGEDSMTQGGKGLKTQGGEDPVL